MLEMRKMRNSREGQANSSAAVALARPKSQFWTNLGRQWYKFSRNRLSLIGLIVVLVIIVAAIFAPWIAPYPAHAGPFVDFANAQLPPSWHHLFGTDDMGRDILSRIIFALRGALIMP